MPCPEVSSLLLEHDKNLLRVSINRPKMRNALSAEVVAELQTVCTFLEVSPDISAVVLRGAEGTFCAGGDISSFRQAMEPAPASPQDDPLAKSNRSFGDFLLRFNALPQTTIAVVEGAAIGGGMGLVCTADIVLALADTRFGLSETRLGVIPAQIAPFVVARLGLATTRRIALTGMRMRGTEAKAIGLVDAIFNDTDALEAETVRYIGEISQCGPRANAATKALLLNIDKAPVEAVLDQGAQAFAVALRGEEAREGIAAFLGKRKPAWTEKNHE